MIPPVVPRDWPSAGEREIFHRLRDDPQTSEWIVLHSFDIAHHTRQISGEADFVIIVPWKGVLCLEVKGASSVRRQEGQWYYGLSSTPDPRGPFKQASECMHSIRQRLQARRPDLARIVFWSAVAFPYVSFSLASDEWHEWQVIDSRSFRASPISALIGRVLDEARGYLGESSSAAWFHAGLKEPSVEQCDGIAEALRPDFEFYESPKSRARRLGREVAQYTQEQFLALDAMAANPRVVFSGPAGTGKTLLALEAARRACTAGQRVMFVCFNRLLGEWLKEQAADLQSQIVTGTLHSRMVAVAGLGSIPPSPGQSFWETELPDRSISILLERQGEEDLFDELVVDEVQDLLRGNYLDFLDLSLKGGLASGRWRLFGDFERQAIYGSGDSISLDGFLETRGGRAPVYSLRTNCRNTPRIAWLAQMLGGLEPGYSKILRPDDRSEPQVYYYEDEGHQGALLSKALEGLHREGYSGGDIVVLSSKAREPCAATLGAKPWGEQLRPLEQRRGGQIGFCSIHAFKGLDAHAVIVTDIDTIGDEAAEALFYVAVTRALHRLVILLHERVKAQVVRALLKAPSA